MPVVKGRLIKRILFSSRQRVYFSVLRWCSNGFIFLIYRSITLRLNYFLNVKQWGNQPFSFSAPSRWSSDVSVPRGEDPLWRLITHHWKCVRTFSTCLSVGNTRASGGAPEVWNDRRKDIEVDRFVRLQTEHVRATEWTLVGFFSVSWIL